MARTRGVNPIWWIPDLVGQPMDDSYYLFVLSNVIPYIPLTVTHDDAGLIPWTNPIEMLANGTVPVDVYWDDSVIYRLEWRDGPTQDDTLIYLVENYSPGENGGSSRGSASNDTTNQITNPQFSIVNFATPYTTTAQGIANIAPGWDIIATGSSGSITVSQITIAGNADNTSNASYALQIQSTGWDTVGIKQTFAHNGALWASGDDDSSVSGVALSINAYKTGSGSAPPLTGIISYAGTTPPDDTTILSVTQINSSPTQYTGAGILPVSTNSADPIDSSTSVSFTWTSNNTVVVTSVQLVGQQGAAIAALNYQQETLERQRDQTFHYYADSLIMQPKESVLTGWNFPQNPWSFTTTSSTNVAANQYTADQTIVAQQAYVASASGNNVAVGQAAAADNYGFKVTAVTATNQFALIQYIDPATIAPYWGRAMSSLLKMRYQNNHSSTGVKVKMRLIYNASLPSSTSQTYPIATWTALGEPVFAGGWTAIAPQNDPAYDVSSLATFTSLPFEGMTLPANSASTMTLGIVIYTVKSMSSTSVADYMVFEECSLVPNDFAIASTVLSYDETLRRCQYYYEKSYAKGVLPGAITAVGQKYAFNAVAYNLAQTLLYLKSFAFDFAQTSRTATPTITFYSPATGTADRISGGILQNGSYPAVNGGNPATVNPFDFASSKWAATGLNADRVFMKCADTDTLQMAWNSGTISDEGVLLWHYTKDSRMGI